MADTVISKPDSIIARIDNDSDSSVMTLKVQHWNPTTSSYETIMTVEESGIVTVYNRVVRNGTHAIVNSDSSGATPVCEFRSGGTGKAWITATGVGNFPRVKLPYTSTEPGTAGVSGVAGQILLFYDTGAGTFKLRMCTGGTTWAVLY